MMFEREIFPYGEEIDTALGEKVYPFVNGILRTSDPKFPQKRGAVGFSPIFSIPELGRLRVELYENAVNGAYSLQQEFDNLEGIEFARQQGDKLHTAFFVPRIYFQKREDREYQLSCLVDIEGMNFLSEYKGDGRDDNTATFKRWRMIGTDVKNMNLTLLTKPVIDQVGLQVFHTSELDFDFGTDE